MGLDGVDILDGGTLGLALLPSIEGREALLVLDAVTSAQAQPGQVLVLTGDALRCTWRRCMSAHQLGITDAIAIAELAGRAPTEVVAVCMVPHSLETGWGLSAPVREQLPQMVAAALGILRSWGVEHA
jgi:hydrogenase maturation protease